MAGRQFFRNRAQLEREAVSLWCSALSNASSATTVFEGKGVTSLARTAAGIYTVTLQDKYAYLIDYKINFSVSDSSDPLAGVGALTAYWLTPDSVNSAKTFKFTVVNGSDTATDVPAGATIRVALTLSNAAAESQ